MNDGKREKKLVEGHWGYGFQKCAVVTRRIKEWRRGKMGEREPTAGEDEDWG